MFSGNHAVTIDEKGRMAVPARFRAALLSEAQGQLSLTRTPDGLRLYPQPVFEHIAKNVIPNHHDLKQRAALRLQFVGEAMAVEMDAQGRVLVPAQYRAELGSSAVLVGQVDFFALYSEAGWAARRSAVADDYSAAFAALDI
ncbi:division/cell wall cluster transcriptional repressor MraZ [Stagnimonas aquatica]|uniref:Transcriptional regulator MraZ n=1 Tax=Stagnimonas aquatica TaxID=2689987 RepID=A0A3N0VKY4_9GAMM|nr:division/cell wall cluster transcriptional repressor MraZ [Stagnimonas aquatica]ROH93429.1 division/cell wall cluster transcriptional repressor MraZ [Stagnimonas aquatica]